MADDKKPRKISVIGSIANLLVLLAILGLFMGRTHTGMGAMTTEGKWGAGAVTFLILFAMSMWIYTMVKTDDYKQEWFQGATL